MAKYDVSCERCQGTFVVQLYGKSEDRQWRLDNFTWVCDACREEERREENARAAASNTALGLPALAGSEKQISWAENIRAQKLAHIEKTISGEYDALTKEAFYGTGGYWNLKKSLPIDHEYFPYALELLKKQISASWWIDIREDKIGFILGELFTENPPTKTEAGRPDADLEAMASAEATVRPETPKTETVAEIQVHGQSVKIVFPEKREDFRDIVKNRLKYRWEGSAWMRTLNLNTGTPVDRAAEAGNLFLRNGFIVRIYDGAIRAAAVSGTFEPECTRWVSKRVGGKYAGWFSIHWGEKNDKLYGASRKLKGSKWDKPSVVVPAEQYEEVQDFSKMFSFKLTQGAEELVESAKKAREAAMTATAIKPPEIDLPPEPGKKPKPLDIPEILEVADEFKD